MINYSLAKQLKDSGFPLRKCDCIERGARTCIVLSFDMDQEGRWTHYPTLSELIEACGEQLHSIRRGTWKGQRGWLASEDWFDSERQCAEPKEPVGVGPTPEAAVAKLYLALHS